MRIEAWHGYAGVKFRKKVQRALATLFPGVNVHMQNHNKQERCRSNRKTNDALVNYLTKKSNQIITLVHKSLFCVNVY